MIFKRTTETQFTTANGGASLQSLLSLEELANVNEDIIRERVETICVERDLLRSENALLKRDMQKLMSYLDQLQHDVIAVEESRAWRWGYYAMAYLKAALGRKPGRYAFANIHRVLTVYHHWKKARD